MCIYKFTSYYGLKLDFIEHSPSQNGDKSMLEDQDQRKRGVVLHMKVYIFYLKYCK